MEEKRHTSPVKFDGTLRAATDGVSVEVEVVPGSTRSAFPTGYNPWRKRIEAKVQAPPEQGAANAELTSLVASFFGVPKTDVTVTAGATGRRKTLHVRGLDADAATRRLGAWTP